MVMGYEGGGSNLGSMPLEMLGLTKSEASKSHLRNLANLSQAMMAYQGENEQARMNAMRQQLGLYQPMLSKLDELYGAGTAPDISGLMNMTSLYPQNRESQRLAGEEAKKMKKENKGGGLLGIPVIDDLLAAIPGLSEIGSFIGL